MLPRIVWTNVSSESAPSKFGRPRPVGARNSHQAYSRPPGLSIRAAIDPRRGTRHDTQAVDALGFLVSTELLTKYAAIVALRDHADSESPLARRTVKALASRFPGALIELECTSPREVERRVSALRDQAASDAQSPLAWSYAIYIYHTAARTLIERRLADHPGYAPGEAEGPLTFERLLGDWRSERDSRVREARGQFEPRLRRALDAEHAETLADRLGKRHPIVARARRVAKKMSGVDPASIRAWLRGQPVP